MAVVRRDVDFATAELARIDRDRVEHGRPLYDLRRQSESAETPTRSSARPSKHTTSVADGRSDTIRTRRL
jgi:hypothetical protein